MAANIVAQMQIILSAITKGMTGPLSDAQKSLLGLQKSAQALNTALSAVGLGFSALAAARVAGEIIRVTAEFEKFGAVLANTLGSQSAAQAALDEIRVFAQETPFEVSEVTAAYVRWANQGLNPTIDKMAKLGDVASSLGAGFEQTAEAFKDLLVGQTKRIEELGISAQQSNGKIQLSFKGVNLEIDKSVEGVEKALDTFSALQGVQGTSAQVSETLGGRISNLKDAYANLLLTLGQSTDATKGSVDFLIELTNAATSLINKLNESDNQFGKFLDFFGEFVTGPTRFLLNLIDSTDEANKKLEENAQKLKAIQSTADAAFASGNIEAYIKALDNNINREEIIAEIRRRQAEEIAKANAARAAEVVSLESLKAKLEELNKQFETTDTNDKKELTNIGRKILATNAQIDALERLRKKQEEVAQGSLSAFGQKSLEDAVLGSKRVQEEELRRTQRATPVTGEALIPETTLPFEDPDRMDAIFSNLLAYTDAVKAAGVAGIQSAEQQILANEQVIESEQRKAAIAAEVGSIFGDTVGDIISGQKTVVEAIKAATVRLLPILLAQALGGTIAGAGKTALPPPVIIALATAGVAAISSLFAKSTGFSRGGASAGGTSTTNVAKLQPVAAQSESISFDAKFRLEGNDLVAAVNSTNNKNGRLGG